MNYIDTGTLFDWAKDGGLDFTDADAGQDAIYIWHDSWMQNPEHLSEVFFDFVSEKHMEMACNGIAKASKDSQWLEENAKNHPYLISAYAGAINNHLATAGAYLQKNLSDKILDVIQKNYADWWVDCCGYYYDMEEGRHEDYEIRHYKEAQCND